MNLTEVYITYLVTIAAIGFCLVKYLFGIHALHNQPKVKRGLKIPPLVPSLIPLLGMLPFKIMWSPRDFVLSAKYGYLTFNGNCGLWRLEISCGIPNPFAHGSSRKPSTSSKARKLSDLSSTNAAFLCFPYMLSSFAACLAFQQARHGSMPRITPAGYPNRIQKAMLSRRTGLNMRFDVLTIAYWLGQASHL